ncbi:MAG TPA: tetratricopeptide repeat protein, partial [Nitrospinota bacterium]|nr:tetratricopeptide repeat protein [Nitrospinota bacterium]
GIIFSYYHLEKYELFLEEGRKFIKEFKEHSLSKNLQYQIGEYYYSKKDLNRALESYSYILNYHPSHEMADGSLFRIGQINLLKKDYYKAAVFFKKLFISYPKSTYLPDAQFLLGDSFFYMKDYKRALKEYDKFINTYSESSLIPEALFNSGLILSQNMNDQNKAEFYFKKIVEQYPNDSLKFDASLELGLIYKRIKKNEDAVRYLKEASLSKNDIIAAKAHLNLGDVYNSKGNLEKSISHYLKVFYLFSIQKDLAHLALIKAGDNYKKLGRYKEALTLYKKGIENSKSEEDRRYLGDKIKDIEKKIESKRSKDEKQ